jgi:hypothetical protein
MVGTDGVHLTSRANKVAAVSLRHRTKEMVEADNNTEKEFKEGWKRRRT